MRVRPWALLASTTWLVSCSLLFEVVDEEGDAGLGGADAGLDASPDDAWCKTVYGDAREFLLCAEDRQSCTFYTQFDHYQGSCQETCLAGGGACLGAIEEAGDHCLPEETLTCTSTDNDLTCTCSRP